MLPQPKIAGNSAIDLILLLKGQKPMTTDKRQINAIYQYKSGSAGHQATEKTPILSAAKNPMPRPRLQLKTRLLQSPFSSWLQSIVESSIFKMIMATTI